MKHIYCIALLLLGMQAVQAQHKLDLTSRMLIQNNEQVRLGCNPAMFDPRVRPVASRAGDAPEVGVIVKLAPGHQLDEILTDGITIASSIADMAIVSLPVDMLESLADNEAVASISAGDIKTSQMYFAREVGLVNPVQTGEGLDKSYTGAGVVVGCMDSGLDPNHINFTNGTNYDESRVKAVYFFNSNNGLPTTSASTPEAIQALTTDDKSSSHGTHVMGIATGSYNGDSSYGMNGNLNSGNMPYYGNATGADIVMSGGSFYDANILAGVQKVIEYGEYVGKPTVVNLSIGSILGSHDGNNATNQYLAALGERGIICIAAGNDGQYNLAVNFKGGRSVSQRANNAVTFNLSESVSYPYMMNFYSNDDAEFELDFVIYDSDTKSVVYSLPIPNLNGGSKAVGGSGTSSAYEKNSYFTSAFTENSYFACWSQVENGRYKVMCQCILNRGNSSNISLQPAVRVSRAAGQSVYGYILSQGGNPTAEFTVQSGTGWDGLNWAQTVVTSDGTISDMATAQNVISVGAYTSAVSWTPLTGGSRYYVDRTAVGEMCLFSSYGSNPVTGEEYPLICAPGSAIIASFNNYANNEQNMTCGKAGGNGRNNLWGVMQGTSMACPFATGVMALWLEANPDLTVAEARDIIASTAIPYTGTDTKLKLQWGKGKLDPIEGIKMVIARKAAGVDNVVADANTGWIINPVGPRSYDITVDGATQFTATLYNLQGAAVAAATATSGNVILEADNAVPGVYVLSVTAPNMAPLSRKVTIR